MNYELHDSQDLSKCKNKKETNAQNSQAANSYIPYENNATSLKKTCSSEPNFGTIRLTACPKYPASETSDSILKVSRAHKLTFFQLVLLILFFLRLQKKPFCALRTRHTCKLPEERIKTEELNDQKESEQNLETSEKNSREQNEKSNSQKNNINEKKNNSLKRISKNCNIDYEKFVKGDDYPFTIPASDKTRVIYYSGDSKCVSYYNYINMERKDKNRKKLKKKKGLLKGLCELFCFKCSCIKDKRKPKKVIFYIGNGIEDYYY
ncbi:Plasmodium exported protein, unknown function [Plasmodium ovale wallikeri]|uniref:Uncharacterized protein n=1 Tax=Plasmodium ovale wallikeri TaxID=864142 RepID=A0A1A8YY93_PLAOA|nr:Plasmodium exported protein, unknown function [Plasmodium ovale wallikeri]SBT57253.1 Plasmodium exported protein, unknown function [Plasmodium ovale wallikeri]